MRFLGSTAVFMAAGTILCVASFCHGALVVTLQPDTGGNVVVSLSTSGTMTTAAGGGDTLHTNGGALFTGMLGDPFGPPFDAGSLSASSDPALQDYKLESSLTMTFGASNFDFVSVEWDSDTGVNQDDFSFGFDSALPASAVAYSVVDTGFSRILDSANAFGNGVNAPIAFSGLNVGSYTETTEPEHTYLNGMTLVISSTVVPEPSSFLCLGLFAFCVMACNWKSIVGCLSRYRSRV